MWEGITEKFFILSPQRTCMRLGRIFSAVFTNTQSSVSENHFAHKRVPESLCYYREQLVWLPCDSFNEFFNLFTGEVGNASYKLYTGKQTSRL